MFNDPLFDPERRRNLNSELKKAIDNLNLQELEEVLDYVGSTIEVIEANMDEEEDFDEEDEEDEPEEDEDEVVEEKHIPDTDDI